MSAKHEAKVEYVTSPVRVLVTGPDFHGAALTLALMPDGSVSWVECEALFADVTYKPEILRAVE